MSRRAWRLSRWGLGMVAPWLTAVLALNLAAVHLLPAPPAKRPRGDFALRFRATLAEAHELLRSRVFVVFPRLRLARSGEPRRLLRAGRAALARARLQRQPDRRALAAGRAGRDRADVGVAAGLAHRRRGKASDAGCCGLRPALDDHGLRPAAGAGGVRPDPARRDLCAGASGRDVFRPARGAAQARRHRAEPLCRVLVGHRDGAGDAGIGAALRGVRRAAPIC